MVPYECKASHWLKLGEELQRERSIACVCLQGSEKDVIDLEVVKKLAQATSVLSLEHLILENVVGEETAILDAAFAPSSALLVPRQVEVWFDMGPSFEHGQMNGWQRRDGVFYRFGMDVNDMYEGDRWQGDAPWRTMKRSRPM